MRRLEPGIREELIGNPAQKHSTGAWYATAHPQRVGSNLISGGLKRKTSVHNVPHVRSKARKARRRR